jgi:Flp pilus assembly CpaE family ATPase
VFASAERHEIVEIRKVSTAAKIAKVPKAATKAYFHLSMQIPAATALSIFREVAGQLASQSAAPAAPAARQAAEPVVPATTAPASSATAPADYSRLFATKAQKQNPRSKKPTFTIFARKDRFMPLICVCSPKGGVGKTTLTANLAYALARSGSKVLALDFDVQNALRLHFGVPLSDERGYVAKAAESSDWSQFV